MSAEIKGLDEVIGKLKRLPQDARIATARAVNDTLVQAQTFTTRTLLPEKFTLRGKGKKWFEPGQKLGFNIRFAKVGSTDIDGSLGSQADFLKLQEDGGEKTAGQHRVAIPDSQYKPKQDLMLASMKPRAILSANDKLAGLKLAHETAQSNLMQAALWLNMHRSVRLETKADKLRREGLKQQLRLARSQARKAEKAHRTAQPSNFKAFVATMQSGFVGIFERIGKGRFPLKLLFSFKKGARIPGILGFEKSAGAVAEKNFPENFEKRFLEAVIK